MFRSIKFSAFHWHGLYSPVIGAPGLFWICGASELTMSFHLFVIINDERLAPHFQVLPFVLLS